MRAVGAIIAILAAAGTVRDASAKVKPIMANAVTDDDRRVVEQAWYYAENGGYTGSIPLPPIDQCWFYRVIEFPYSTGGVKYIAEFDVPWAPYQEFYVFTFLFTGTESDLQRKLGGKSRSSGDSSSSSDSDESGSSGNGANSAYFDSRDFSDYDLRVLDIDDGTRLTEHK